jgi:hypothetical protein
LDLSRLLAQLHQELENLDQAIRSLERIEHRVGQAQLPENLRLESGKSRRPTGKSRATQVRKATDKPG